MDDQVQHYILDEQNRPVAVSEDRWIEWAVQRGGLAIERTMVGDMLVSTVFLGVGGSLWGAPPRLFETVVLDSDGESSKERRYRTWAEAQHGHREIVVQLERARAQASEILASLSGR